MDLWIIPLDDSPKILYARLDASRPRRIIKDIMRHQLGEGEEANNRSTLETTGSKESHEPDVLVDDEIEPADLFDPEEFGYRRRGTHDPRA